MSYHDYRKDLCHYCGEWFKGKSMTVPDQSLTLREIMQRSLSGVSPEQFNNDNYDGSVDDFEVRKNQGEDIFDDPTREPGFDFVDAFNLEKDLRAKETKYEKGRAKEKEAREREKKDRQAADAAELAALREAKKKET